MPKAVIFDIDGVLAEKSPERDYREYDKVGLDKPIEQYFMLLSQYANDYSPAKGHWKENYKILFITGRKEYCREITEIWLGNNFSRTLENDPIYYYIEDCNLFMRPNDDHRKAVVLKKEIYEQHIKGKYEVELAIDDDPEICEMWKNEGIKTLEVKRLTNNK